MYVERLTVRNFRHLSDIDLTFDAPRALIIGENGAGKSSVIDALEWCLTGRCRGIDGRGVGRDLQIAHGATAMEVTSVIKGVGVITRTLGATGSTSCSMKQEAIYARLGTTEDLLRTALHGELFFKLAHKEANELLMRMLNITIPADKLPALGPLPGPLGLDDLDARYKKAFDDRASTKKALDAMGSETAASGAPPDPDALKEARAELDAARKATRETAQALSTATADARTYTQDVERTRAVINRSEARIRDAEPMKAARAEKQADLDALAAIATRSDLETLKTGGQVRLTAIASTLDALSTHGGSGCVLDQSIPCGTPATTFATHRAGLEDETARLRRQLAVVDRHLEEQRHRADRRARLQDEIATIDLALRDATEADASLPTLRKNLADAQQALSAAEAAVATARQQAERTQAREDEAIAAVTKLEGQQQAATTGTAARERRQKLDASLKTLEAQVKALGPKGVRVQAIKEAVGRFELIMASALAPFGFSIVFQIDPWQVFVKVGEAAPVPFVQLSRGQQVRVATAFALAVASLSGLDFCAIDNADTLDPKGRKAFTRLVMEARIGQALIGMMKADDETVPELPGLMTVRLQQGRPIGAHRDEPRAAAARA